MVIYLNISQIFLEIFGTFFFKYAFISYQYKILSKLKNWILWILHPWIGSTKKNKSVEPKQSLLSQIVAYASRNAQVIRGMCLNWWGLIQRLESWITHSLHNSHVGSSTYLNRYAFRRLVEYIWNDEARFKDDNHSVPHFYFSL